MATPSPLAAAAAAAAKAAGESDPELRPEIAVVAWLSAQLDAEVSRVRATGQRVVPVGVKNCGIVVEEAPRAHAQRPAGGAAPPSAPPAPVPIHRIEASTAFDFSGVQHILLSEPVACPVKPGYAYRHVVLVTASASAPPLMLPYIYDEATAGGDFSTWRLVNSELQEATHVIAGDTVEVLGEGSPQPPPPPPRADGKGKRPGSGGGGGKRGKKAAR